MALRAATGLNTCRFAWRRYQGCWQPAGYQSMWHCFRSPLLTRAAMSASEFLWIWRLPCSLWRDEVIAEVNPAMPRTHGDSLVHVDHFDALVSVDTPVTDYHHPPTGETAEIVARSSLP